MSTPGKELIESAKEAVLLAKSDAARVSKSKLLRPIQLSSIKVDGISVNSALPGDTVKIMVRGGLTSDEPIFHSIIEGLEGVVSTALKRSLQSINWNSVSSFVVIIKPDDSAELYLNGIELQMHCRVKEDIAQGEILYFSKIADIDAVRLSNIELDEKYRVVVCLKVNWKFLLYFDLKRDETIDLGQFEREIGRLYRRILYQDEYNLFRDTDVRQKISDEGWFPFIEILGEDYRSLYKSVSDPRFFAHVEDKLVKSFDDDRIEKISKRWKAHPKLEGKLNILEAGMAAYRREDFISCIKNLITEIEGIVKQSKSGDSKIETAWPEYLEEKGTEKTGDADSLFFASEFRKYLEQSIYSKFDSGGGYVETAGRHSVSHGGAHQIAYTKKRAVQVILALDQALFYL